MAIPGFYLCHVAALSFASCWVRSSLKVIFMKVADVCARAFAMPLNHPSYPSGPYRFCHRESLVVEYLTVPRALRAAVPEPLQISGPVVNSFACRIRALGIEVASLEALYELEPGCGATGTDLSIPDRGLLAGSDAARFCRVEGSSAD